MSTSQPETSGRIFLFGTDGAPSCEVGAETVGRKALNLIRMTEAGLPVPPGFVLPTTLCVEYFQAGRRLPDDAIELVTTGIAALEAQSGLVFGGARRPLLVAVRSGAAASMPGMLETILDVGLTEANLPGLLRLTGNPRFVWDSYRRLIEAYGEVVLGCPAEIFSRILTAAMQREAVPSAGELDVAALQGVARDLKAAIAAHAGVAFPEDPMEQLLGAVEAVLASWEGPKAVQFRALEGLSELPGTAITVQTMVFGNMGANSGSGVAFTRDPMDGEDRLYLDFLFNVQGEDVVSGRHRGDDAGLLVANFPELYRELHDVRRRLEHLFRDVCDFEFTVQEGKLYVLQSRAAKRTAWAALQFACDLVDEGVIDEASALERLSAYDLETIVRQRLAHDPAREPLAVGVPASPGVASGRIAVDVERAQQIAGDGRVVLVRDNVSTEDVAGLAVCEGLLTAGGNRTSHGAVVARHLGKVCVVGCEDLRLDPDGHGCTINGEWLPTGSTLTIDGGTGYVYAGELPVVEEHPGALVERVRSWQGSEEPSSVR